MAYIGNQPVPQATQTRDSFTATASQTTFTTSNGYSVGFIDVFMNGVKLAGADFTATDSSTVVLASGAASGDILDIIAYDTFNPSNALLISNNLSDVASAATSRTNLGLEIGVDVQAYDATILVDADIGSTVQAYDADTTKNDVANTFTADQTISAELIADSYNESYNAVTSTSNATTVDCETGNVFSHTLTENTTFTFSNPPTTGISYSFSLRIVQDASASGFTVAWPASVDWAAATAPTLTTTANAVDWLVFLTVDGGTTWYGFVAGQAMG